MKLYFSSVINEFYPIIKYALLISKTNEFKFFNILIIVYYDEIIKLLKELLKLKDEVKLSILN